MTNTVPMDDTSSMDDTWGKILRWARVQGFQPSYVIAIEKDRARLESLFAKPTPEKTLRHAKVMANRIKDIDKAFRRAHASIRIGHKRSITREVMNIFLQRVIVLVAEKMDAPAHCIVEARNILYG